MSSEGRTLCIADQKIIALLAPMTKRVQPQKLDVIMEPGEDDATSTYSGTSTTSRTSTRSLHSNPKAKSRPINGSQVKPNYIAEDNSM